MIYNLPKDTLPPQLFPSRYFLHKCNFENHFPITAETFFILGSQDITFSPRIRLPSRRYIIYLRYAPPTQSFFQVDVLLNVCNFENRFHITADTYFILVGYARHYFKAQKYGYRQDGKPFT